MRLIHRNTLLSSGSSKRSKTTKLSIGHFNLEESKYPQLRTDEEEFNADCDEDEQLMNMPMPNTLRHLSNMSYE